MRRIIDTIPYVLLVAFAAAGCEKDAATQGPTETGPGTLELRKNVLVESASTIEATYVEAETSFVALNEALQGDDPDEMRAAFSNSMDVWQRAESMIVGPAGMAGQAAGGKDFRDQIYSWPLSNACAVDQETVAKNYETAELLRSQPVNRRGLDALEYLLFVDNAENQCDPNLSINRMGDWAALSEAEIAERRIDYARQLGGLLVEDIRALRAEWAAGEDTFRAEFVDPASGDTYDSTRASLNALSDALFYLEKEVKDMKLAPPAGISDCLDEVCPDKRESLWADRSLANIRKNIEGFLVIYRGDGEDAPGFDDLLASVDQAELDQSIQSKLEEALALIDSIDGSMAATLASNPDKITNLHGLLKEFALLLKTEFVTVLDLDLPKRAEGDND